jgi:hypothetical protein
VVIARGLRYLRGDGDDQVILLLLSCAGEPEPEAPSAYTYTSPEVEDIADPVVMQEEVQDVIDNLRTFNAGPVIDAWFAARAYGDDLCPDETISDSAANGHVTYFDILCVVDDRIWFKGPMTSYEFTDNDLIKFEMYDPKPYMDGVKAYWTGTAIKGQSDVYDTESDLDYNCSCTAILADGPDVKELFYSWLSYTDGPSHLTAPESDPSLWMNQGIFSHLFLQFDRKVDDPRWQANLVGELSGYTSTYGDVELDLEISGDLIDGVITCEPGTGGTMSARHTDTGVRTELDIVVDEDCNSCSPVGDGEVCLNFTELMNWDSDPW